MTGDIRLTVSNAEQHLTGGESNASRDYFSPKLYSKCQPDRLLSLLLLCIFWLFFSAVVVNVAVAMISFF